MVRESITLPVLTARLGKMMYFDDLEQFSIKRQEKPTVLNEHDFDGIIKPLPLESETLVTLDSYAKNDVN